MNNIEQNNYQVFDVTKDYCPVVVLDSSKNGLRHEERKNKRQWIKITYQLDRDFNNENFKINFDSLIELFKVDKKCKLDVTFETFDTYKHSSLDELNNQKTAIKVIKQALGKLNEIQKKYKSIEIRVLFHFNISVGGKIYWDYDTIHNNVSYESNLSKLDNLLKEIDVIVHQETTTWYESKIFIGIVIAFVVILILITIILIKRNKNNKKVS